MFSIDALFALVIVVIAGLALFLAFQNASARDFQHDLTALKAQDRAMTSFYLGDEQANPALKQAASPSLLNFDFVYCSLIPTSATTFIESCEGS